MTTGQDFLVAGGIPLAAGVAAYAVHVADLVRQWWRDSNANVDRMLATLDEHADQALEVVTGIPVVRCGECTDPLDDVNRAPGCLSHDTCLACAPTPYCDECRHELDAAGLLETPVPFTLTEQAWGWAR